MLHHNFDIYLLKISLSPTHFLLGGSGDEDETRTSTPNQLSSSKGKERFFWQYNVQAKGPKGKRLVFQSKLEDPHVLNEVTDPVFSPTCSVRGIKVYKVRMNEIGKIIKNQLGLSFYINI